MKEIVLIVIVLVGIYTFAPKLWTDGEALLRDYTTWTDEAKRKDPVGYLNYARRRLEANLQKMEEIKEKLEQRLRRLQGEKKKTTQNEGQYQTLLYSGRTIYRQAEQTSRYPVTFVGANYRKDELEAQLRILFQRHARAKQQIADMERAYNDAIKWLGEMYEKRAQAKNELTSLKTTIVIAEAYEAATEVERTIRHIGEVTEDFDAYIGDLESTKLPLRDPDELLRREYRGASEAEFQKFLRGV
jgi:chromosome segregation ATPase